MSLSRTFDAAFLNEVANHAEVRPWLGGDRVSVIDLTALIETEGNVALINEHGGFVFVELMPGVFEVHTQFLPSGRGLATAAAWEAAEYMFDTVMAEKLLTDVPEDNVAAHALAVRAGFVDVSDRFDDGGELSGKPQRIIEMEMTPETFRRASGGLRSGTMDYRNGAAQCQ